MYSNSNVISSLIAGLNTTGASKSGASKLSHFSLHWKVMVKVGGFLILELFI